MTNNEMWQQRERLVLTKWRPMMPLILVPIRKHSFAYFGNEITNDCPFCTSPFSHLHPAFLSHFSFLTRCFPLIPFSVSFAAFLCHIPLPTSRDTNCNSNSSSSMSHKRLVLCHLLPSFLGGNSSQVMELSLVICIKRQKLSQIALAHKHCLAVSACVTISFPGPETVQTAKTVDSQRKSLSKVNSWRGLQKWRKGCTICCLS